MSGLRLFWTFSIVLCVCALPCGHAAYAARPAKPIVQKNVTKSVETRVGVKASARVSGRSGKRVVVKRGKRASLPPASAELPQSGAASWVGSAFHGKPVANGERYVMEKLTAAHRAIPFGSILKVTDMRNGRSVLVRVNDRGPYVRGRVIDLSRAAAEHLDFAARGLTTVRLELAGSDKDPAQRYYIRTGPAHGPGTSGPVRGFGPFEAFDEAAALFTRVSASCPEAELLAVREEG